MVQNDDSLQKAMQGEILRDFLLSSAVESEIPDPVELTFEEKYPFPSKSMLLIADLHKSEKISREETNILSQALLWYMDLRCEARDGTSQRGNNRQ